MLIEFSVENFMSIRDKVTLSLLTGKESENMDNVILNEKNNVLKSIAIYGANASGKSNIFKAITAAIILIRTSNNRQVNEKLLNIVPFKFDEDSKVKPSKFQFVFETNGTRYVYGFSADINQVYEEYLYQYLTAKPTTIFERKDVNNYEFKKDGSELLKLSKTNTPNKLFLATATAWNYERTKEPYMWFANNIDTFNSNADFKNQAFDMFENDKNEELKKFTLNLLKEAEINIDNFEIQKEEISQEQLSLMLPNEMIRNIFAHGNANLKGIGRNVFTNHNVNNNIYILNMAEESLGTQNIFFLSPLLMDTLSKGKTIIIDEIEKSLHTSLVRYIIELFHNPEINKNNAQIIFNTHDTNLLSLDIFRRDQIYFVEKDFSNATTDLYSLDEFSVRKSENIEKGYLQGRYGAIPAIGIGDSLWK